MKKISKLTFLLFALTIIESVFGASNKQEKFLITGYVNSNRMNSERNLEFIPNLDRIYFFGMSPDIDGSFIVRDKYVENYMLIRSKMNKNQKILLVVGGGATVANMHIMGNDSLKRETYVKQLVAFAKKYKFDGIDMDWEIDGTVKPNKLVPTENLIAILTSIKNQMPKKTILTATLAGASFQQTADIYKYVEDVSVRFYASLNKEGLHAPLNTVKEGLQKYKTVNCPNNKLLIGVPFYARGANHKTIFYSEIVKHLTPGDTVTAMYDGCSFNSVQIMRNKVRYFKEQGYKGIMIWELTQDASYSHPLSLLRAICDEAKVALKP
jgi:chitinase